MPKGLGSAYRRPDHQGGRPEVTISRRKLNAFDKGTLSQALAKLPGREDWFQVWAGRDDATAQSLDRLAADGRLQCAAIRCRNTGILWNTYFRPDSVRGIADARRKARWKPRDLRRLQEWALASGLYDEAHNAALRAELKAAQ